MHNLLSKRLFFCALFTLALSISYVGFAEDNDSKTKQTSTKEKSTNQSKPYTSKRARIKTLEEFVPSEEVSADKPVAFPSDI